MGLSKISKLFRNFITTPSPRPARSPSSSSRPKPMPKASSSRNLFKAINGVHANNTNWLMKNGTSINNRNLPNNSFLNNKAGPGASAQRSSAQKRSPPKRFDPEQTARIWNGYANLGKRWEGQKNLIKQRTPAATQRTPAAVRRTPAAVQRTPPPCRGPNRGPLLRGRLPGAIHSTRGSRR